jgi:hypothetical protein
MREFNRVELTGETLRNTCSISNETAIDRKSDRRDSENHEDRLKSDPDVHVISLVSVSVSSECRSSSM